MLAIQREPLYKNKLFLSSVAVLSGFIFTVGIIRAVNPADTSTQQSAQTSERRSSTLLPINASEAESSSESGSGPAASGASDVSNTSGQSAETTSSSAAAKAPTASGATGSGARAQNNQTAPAQQTQPAPASSNPQCLANVLGNALLCH